MKPGPELDALVAETVLGRSLCRDVHCAGCSASGGYLTADGWRHVLPYSSDLTACAAAAEEARKAGKIAHWQAGDLGAAVYIHGRVMPREMEGESAAHALALALLKAVGHV